MSSMSNYLEDALVNATLRGTTFTAPSVGSLYLALFTADPTDANVTANEVDAAWYTRKTTGSWTAPSNGQSTNVAAITFPAVTGAQSTVTHLGIYDAAFAGNLLYHSPLVQSKTLDIGDVLSFAVGAISVTLA